MRSERPTYSGAGSDPWSEVPPDLEEMLRAELARKTVPGPQVPASQPPETFVATTEGVTAPTEARASDEAPQPTAAKRGRPRRATAEPAPVESAAEVTTAAKPKVTRSRTTKAAATGATAEQGEAPAKTTRTRKPRATAVANRDAASSEVDAADVAAKPVTRRRRTKATDETTEVAPE